MRISLINEGSWHSANLPRSARSFSASAEICAGSSYAYGSTRNMGELRVRVYGYMAYGSTQLLEENRKIKRFYYY